MDILKELEKIEGVCGYYYKNLVTGKVVNYNGDEEYHPASMIKLPVLMAIMKLAKDGEASFKEKITVKYEERVPSCGAFNAFTDEPVVDVKTLCELMIVISDNTASNLLIKHYGINRLNKAMQELGFLKTRLERCFYDDKMQEKGYNNKIVPSEMGEMLEKLYNHSLIDEKTSKYILYIMNKQQRNGLITLFFNDKYITANKTGGTIKYIGDEGIVYGNRPFVYTIISNDTDVAKTTMIYNKGSEILYNEDAINE